MRQYHIHPSVSLYHGNFHKAINFTISKKGPLVYKKYFASGLYFSLFSFVYLFELSFVKIRNDIFVKQLKNEDGRYISINPKKSFMDTALLGVGSWRTRPIFLHSKSVPFYGANTIKVYLTRILFEN